GKDIRDIEITSRIYSLYQAKLSEKPLAIDIISEIYKIIPSNIILNNLSYQEKEFIILKGTAMDLSSISNLVNTLGKSAYFKNVNLKYVNKQKNINQDSIEFEIVCSIKAEK
ncbi:MAG: PilN domain-containing protein, partial [Candidatus Omnitrophota bacterium]